MIALRVVESGQFPPNVQVVRKDIVKVSNIGDERLQVVYLFQLPTVVDQKALEIFFDRLVNVKKNNVRMGLSIKQKPRCFQVVLSPFNPLLNEFLHKAPFPRS